MSGRRPKRPYKPGDIVLVRSPAGKAIPQVHVRLLEKHTRQPSAGRNMNWPGYVGWDAELINAQEVAILRKRWCIPYRFPTDVHTFVFESDIIRKSRPKKRKSS